MGLSSSAIIHFTHSKESLEGILKDNFKIKYCLEHLILGNKPIKIAVPMISFCDIPLSEIKDHITKYGSYGIGLTKEWAIRMKLNPVLYVERDSFLSRSYNTVYDEYLVKSNKDRNTADNKEKCLADIIRYIKNYEGELNRNGKLEKNYRFSDEREWRHVLDFNHSKDFLLPGRFFDTDEKKQKVNSAVSEYRLEFTPKDIKYIIINNESEISSFLVLLRNSKGNNYSYQDIEHLTTRIITSEQIMVDF